MIVAPENSGHKNKKRRIPPTISKTNMARLA